jgi:hypothetical protein
VLLGQQDLKAQQVQQERKVQLVIREQLVHKV